MPDVGARLRDLATYLAHHPPRTREELAEFFPQFGPGEAGRQAFERDKKMLREAGVPVREDGGRYWIDPDEYFLDLDLTYDERVALGVATAAVPVAGGPSLEARLTLGGLGGQLADPPPFLAELDDADALPVVVDACRNRATLSFGYAGSGRVVEPYGVLFRDGFWYLHALDRGDGVRKNFRIDRVEGEPVPGEAGVFDRPADLDLNAELRREVWRLPGGDAVEVTVRVDAVLAAKARHEAGPDATVAEGADGSVELRLTVTNHDAFRSWLLGFREHAVVTGPPEVRAALRDWLAAVVAASAGSSGPVG